MENKWKRYTVTAALPYANGGIHLGHLAGAYLPADTYARYRRLKGDDVLYICGSDEHGVPITLGARKEGITPQQFVDKYHSLMKNSFAEFGISFDIYSRTSNKIHHETAQQFFLDLYNKGVFTEETSQQLYDEQEKMFLADRYIMGTCPVCGNEKAYGDQCEKCGSSLSPKDLKNPVSVLSGNVPVMKETKHWYLPLQNYEPWLREWILDNHKDDWKTNVYGQCKSWLDGGLQPRAMTRDLDWGVKVPLPGSEHKVLYVWFDAPIGYISATKELKPNDWEKYWKDKDTRLLHFIGKDNIVFHCIIFPTILHSHGEYIVPDNVPANEFLNLEGEKLSTSRNWAVWLHDYLKDFPGMQDTLRYVLTSIAPETKDSDFTWKDFQDRHNNELVAILGNFVNRTMVLTHKFYNGKIPVYGNLTESDRELIASIKVAQQNICDSLEKFRFREALQELMNLARAGNKYLTDNEPWKIVKSNEERCATVMYLSIEITAYLAQLMQPFLPVAAEKTLSMLNLPKKNWSAELKGQLIHPGHQLNEAGLMFRKIEDEEITAQVEKLKANQKQVVLQTEPKNPESEIANSVINYDDFAKLELRVGTVTAAEKVKKADKLLQLTIDMGNEVRTIVSGIAEHYTPEQMIGKQVSVVANLAPRKIKGIESKGMILMAEDADGKLKIVSPAETVNSGSKIS
ncbi:methionine--tRNA ligase [Bacteroidota bacterium]|nr:methionine--tRNA ligase [Bacteroidota bacterium]